MPLQHKELQKSNSFLDTRLEMFDTKSTIPNPSVRRSGYPSFDSTESTSLSTGRTSSTAATDLEYKTPATSEHTRSDREHAAYFSSLIDPVIQSNGISEEPQELERGHQQLLSRLSPALCSTQDLSQFRTGMQPSYSQQFLRHQETGELPPGR